MNEKGIGEKERYRICKQTNKQEGDEEERED